MATDRRGLRATPGLRFAKLLGTGGGRTFTPRDADPLHWGFLAVWDDATSADAFAGHRLHRGWNALARERLDVRMVPLSSRGRWAGREPFGTPLPDGEAPVGPIAAITRARLRWRRARAFWRASPAVAADLHTGAGPLLAIGIGEAPIGLQGTFSLWRSAAELTEFAYRRAPHAAAIRRTPDEGWYAEELFARLRVITMTGTYRGRRLEWDAGEASVDSRP